MSHTITNLERLASLSRPQKCDEHCHLWRDRNACMKAEREKVEKEEGRMEEVETSVFEKIAMGNACECIVGCSECQISLKNTGSLCMKNMSAEIVRLRAEREKNPGVWDGAPEWADRCVLRWEGSTKPEWMQYKQYTRTLPKTKAREIAERKAKIGGRYGIFNVPEEYLVDIIESAINEALECEK